MIKRVIFGCRHRLLNPGLAQPDECRVLQRLITRQKGMEAAIGNSHWRSLKPTDILKQ